MMRAFFDTNILVYLFDEDSREKKKIARDLFENKMKNGQAGLSTQVLQEFYVAVTRKLANPLSPEEAETVVQKLTAFPIIQIDAALVLAAIAKSRTLGFSFWDSLVVVAALSGNVDTLYSEDLQHGQIIDGMEIVNPFV